MGVRAPSTSSTASCSALTIRRTCAAVCPGLLKTSASAGIPGYVDSYLFAEQATLRKEADAAP